MSRFFTSPSSASTSSSCSLLLLSHIIIVIGAPDGDGDDCLASCVRFWGHWVKSQAIYLRELHGFFTCCLRPVGAVVAARDDIDIIIRRVPRARRRQTDSQRDLLEITTRNAAVTLLTFAFNLYISHLLRLVLLLLLLLHVAVFNLRRRGVSICFLSVLAWLCLHLLSINC